MSAASEEDRRTGGTLAFVLGDQLSPELSALDGLDRDRDAVWMAELPDEIERIPSHKVRIVAFLAAMRHARDELRTRGWTVHYSALADDPGTGDAAASNASDASTASDASDASDAHDAFHRDGRPAPASMVESLEAAVRHVRPERIVLTRPGSWRVLHALRSAAGRLDVPLELREDTRFLSSPGHFAAWADGRKRLVLEDFYRFMRREHGVLLTDDGGPVGERWNFDEENRESFGRAGPPEIPRPPSFEPDRITREVIELVEARWPDHPGHLDRFDLPVTCAQATEALEHFLEHRLPFFGRFQDAMWSDRPFLAHSRLSVPLNLGLLDPRVCVREAERACRERGAPLAAVEGFVRQVLGWREYVRGLYWHHMPDYASMNALEADHDVPAFLWDGDTEMECVRQAMAGVLDHAYAHHIQRLMVLGLFCLLHGVDPARFNDWHLAMFADAVDQVSLPNTLGMSQFADAGIVGTKPYCASGRYIDRMSDHCRHCRFDPKEATGDDACPFTTLYWDFLARHEDRLRANRRMNFQYANLDRKDSGELEAIRARAASIRTDVAAGERV